MFLSKKYNRVPHFFTINLFFAQVSTRPHELLNTFSRFDAVKSFCGCKVMWVHFHLCCFYALSSFWRVLGWLCGALWWQKRIPLGRLWFSCCYGLPSTALTCGQVCVVPTCVILHQTATDLFCWPLTFSNFHGLGLIALSLVLLKRSEDLNVSPVVFVFAGWGWVSLRQKWNLTCLLQRQF